MKILGLIFVVISMIFLIISRTLRKTRFFVFKDTSMIFQYIIAIILLAIGVIFLYFSGTFN